MSVMEKGDFIEHSLLPLLQRVDEDIRTAIYILDDKTSEEYCLVYFKNGYTKRICITGDSLAAIVRDVLKTL